MINVYAINTKLSCLSKQDTVGMGSGQRISTTEHNRGREEILSIS